MFPKGKHNVARTHSYHCSCHLFGRRLQWPLRRLLLCVRLHPPNSLDLTAELESRVASDPRVIVRLREVVNAGSRFVECPQKLFWLVLQRNFTGRAPNLAAGLQPSDLLFKLMEAVRAFQWPRGLFIIHAASSNASGSTRCV